VLPGGREPKGAARRAPVLIGIALALAHGVRAGAPEEAAVAYLLREVPRWFPENACFSCHHNGDGARALYAAKGRGYAVSPQALEKTTLWLIRPEEWDKGEADPVFRDKKLARIQYSAALAAAVEIGLVQDKRVLRRAAESLLPYQEADGSWQVDAGASIGSPATYGTALATYLVLRTLKFAGSNRLAAAIARAEEWFRTMQPQSVPDLAAALLAAPGPGPKGKALADKLVEAQGSDGGWGPQRFAPSQPFDTALVLLALSSSALAGQAAHALHRGRQFLLRTQLPNGGWPETTRPPGARSYAQHVSTSAWATLALLATDSKRK
jgi:squalene cyclase